MASDDDSDDGRKRPRRRLMTDTERVMVGVERRRQDYSDRYRRIEPDDAFPDDEITSPERVLERDPTDLELEILRRLGIPFDQTVKMRDFAKVLSRVLRKEQEQSSGTKELGRQMAEFRKLLDTPPNALTADLQDRVEKLEEGREASKASLKRWKGWVVTAIVAAVGSIGTAAAKLYDRGKEDATSSFRLQYVERRLDRAEKLLDRLSDHRKDWSVDYDIAPKKE